MIIRVQVRAAAFMELPEKEAHLAWRNAWLMRRLSRHAPVSMIQSEMFSRSRSVQACMHKAIT